MGLGQLEDNHQISIFELLGEKGDYDIMKDYQTGAIRDTGGKGRMDLLPMCALIRISVHMENAIRPDPRTGRPHYPERNWEKGLPLHTMLDSALRHLAKYMAGMTDEDHLCAAATNLLMAMWTEENKPDMQDIPTRPYWVGPTPIDDDLNIAAKRIKYADCWASQPGDHPDTREGCLNG